jgi:peptide/nickel transport system substrate-binding protein
MVSLAVIVLVSMMASAAMAAEQPKAGGTLIFAVAAEPASYDLHRETSFASIHPVAPHYSLLIKFDQWKYPEIEGDVAESWSISKDGLTYTFKLRKGIKFHDGSLLTAKDVKATYDKIIFPPEGVSSARKASYDMVKSVEAPDDQTVVFRLEWAAASLLANLASPWNPIYKADILAKDPHWYEKNIMGTGPFTFVEHVKGSHWVGKKNSDYFMKDRPYLDGFQAIFIRDTSARVATIRGGRALIEFRGFSPAARDDLVRALGPQITVQESPWLCVLTVALNTQHKPFDDPRVRRALSLAVDRWGGSDHLSQISLVKSVGGVIRPGYNEYAPTEAELAKLPGFSKDIQASRKEAKRLLAEAGYPNGFGFAFKNRDVKEPYETVGVWLIDQWRRVGLNARHVVQETAAFTRDLRSGNFEAGMDFACDFMDEPDLQLFKYVSSSKNPSNYAKYNNPKLDALYEKQSKTTDPAARRKLVREFEEIVLSEAYIVPTIWWERINPHWSKVHGWKQLPSHYLNQDLRDVWLAEP